MPKKAASATFAILGKKIGMTQIYNANGDIVPCTVVQVGPCKVLQVKTVENDGYTAIQIGFDDKKKSRILKPEAGHFAKSNSPVKRFVKEVRLELSDVTNYEVGQELNASHLQVGDKIDVAGTSIGKGFQGVLKRHNFRSKPQTHGTHEHFRHGGSIGCRSTPGRVFKNKKMPGQMGNEEVTTQNLEVVALEVDKNIVFVKGAVPGAKNGYLYIKGSVKGGFGARDFAAATAPATTAPAAE
ncbi:MAG: 50S ribosomal protein L3 [Bdellovibrionota bacterium]